METKHANTISEKGLDGEKYIQQILSEHGWRSIYVGGKQFYEEFGSKFWVVDIVAWKEGKTIWVQAKSKEPRKYYPDTGFELWRYKNYNKHQKESGLPILILFVEESGRVYGDWLNNLETIKSNHGSTWNNKEGCEMIYFLVDKLCDPKDLLK